ncbi:MAG: hypothetical protein B9S32_13865 [Verrucomicrobia bacterium Tous-C9LFEB]|nr:MAG: hypothetical protein B9S32_13865 [Verrucomicrobia bacterium Tous-C9LFEB]
MAAIKNDGSIPYGSKVLTIATVTYVADSIKVSRPSKVIERTNEIDEPSGQVIIGGFVTGDATLQLATAATAYPPLGSEFTITLDTVIGAETFIITERDDAVAKGDETKVPIKFRKKISD